MKNLRKTRARDGSPVNVSDRVQHERLVRRFHEDEERENIKNLLFGEARLQRPAPTDED